MQVEANCVPAVPLQPCCRPPRWHPCCHCRRRASFFSRSCPAWRTCWPRAGLSAMSWPSSTTRSVRGCVLRGAESWARGSPATGVGRQPGQAHFLGRMWALESSRLHSDCGSAHLSGLEQITPLCEPAFRSGDSNVTWSCEESIRRGDEVPGNWGISFLAVPSLLGGWGTENKTPRGPCHPLSLWASSCAPGYLGLGVHPTGWGRHRQPQTCPAPRGGEAQQRKEGRRSRACLQVQAGFTSPGTCAARAWAGGQCEWSTGVS